VDGSRRQGGPLGWDTRLLAGRTNHPIKTEPGPEGQWADEVAMSRISRDEFLDRQDLARMKSRWPKYTPEQRALWVDMIQRSLAREPDYKGRQFAAFLEWIRSIDN
jgi:hypothetical protein